MNLIALRYGFAIGCLISQCPFFQVIFYHWLSKQVSWFASFVSIYATIEFIYSTIGFISPLLAHVSFNRRSCLRTFLNKLAYIAFRPVHVTFIFGFVYAHVNDRFRECTTNVIYLFIDHCHFSTNVFFLFTRDYLSVQLSLSRPRFIF